MVTSADLRDLEARLDRRFAAIDVRFAELRGELHREFAQQTRQLGIWMFGVMTTFAGVTLGAVALS